MKPTLDENGRLIHRDDYRISSLNCGGEDFAIACMRSNLKYGKNQKREDVKSHHYIISFDPRDVQDNGLTVDRAQLWNTSKRKSWRCATGKTSIRLIYSTGARTELPSVSIGRNGKDKPHWIKRTLPKPSQESRRRLSYLTPDRAKPITARKLGDDFDRAAVLETLTQNTQNAARAAKKAEGKGRGYEKWATLHNSKQMAATVSIYEESGFSSSEEMEAAFAASLCLSLTISAWSVARNTA